jgi:protein-S-isoprenylcysteine O-methyltransferase Ste14
MLSAIQICGWLWTIWLVIWLAWAFHSKQTRQRESGLSRLSYGVLVWAAVVLFFYRGPLPGWLNASIFQYQSWFGPVAIAITALGFAFTIWARAFLGANWSGTVTIKVGHELIRTGPYRLVRHPIYTGIIMAAFGTALAYDRWRCVVALPLLWFAFTVKRLKEEKFMRQTFGSQYDDYARTTGAIFPQMLRRSA